MSTGLLLQCDDTEETKRFYEDYLGFDVIEFLPDTCTVKKGDCELVFTTEDIRCSAPHFSGVIELYIEDLEEYYQRLQPYLESSLMQSDGVGFTLTDFDGYHLAFLQKQGHSNLRIDSSL